MKKDTEKALKPLEVYRNLICLICLVLVFFGVIILFVQPVELTNFVYGNFTVEHVKAPVYLVLFGMI